MNWLVKFKLHPTWLLMKTVYMALTLFVVLGKYSSNHLDPLNCEMNEGRGVGGLGGEGVGGGGGLGVIRLGGTSFTTGLGNFCTLGLGGGFGVSLGVSGLGSGAGV